MFGSVNGADYPIIRDDGTLRGSCETLVGGAIKPAAPVFNPVVKNELDLIWRDEDLTLVLEANDELILLDNA